MPDNPLKRLLSIRFLFLRSATAAGALFAGLIQTFVFARVLSPQLFSIFILVGTFGVTLSLLDLGVVKTLFVRLRARHLAGDRSATVASHATAIVVFYGALVVASTLICFALTLTWPSVSLPMAGEFALFFLFAALNFVWFALRNISIAVDEFIFFETLEAFRRGGNTALTLAMLIGLPLPAFLILINLLWAVLLWLSLARLLERGALDPGLGGLPRRLYLFYRENRAPLLRSGTYAVTEIYVYSLPYLVVSTFFGLGAPTIILDTTFKVVRGASLIYAAANDLVVPRQTRAFAEHDAPTLVRATLMGAALCAIPAAMLCGLLLFAAKPMFAMLLGAAATMPAATAPILVVLLLTNLLQMIAHSALVHNGFFKEVARLGLFTVLVMTGATAFALLAGVDIVGFLEVYAAVYGLGAFAAVVLMIRGPFRSAQQPLVAAAASEVAPR